jgi:hypothetical protein
MPFAQSAFSFLKARMQPVVGVRIVARFISTVGGRFYGSMLLLFPQNVKLFFVETIKNCFSAD